MARTCRFPCRIRLGRQHCTDKAQCPWAAAVTDGPNDHREDLVDLSAAPVVAILTREPPHELLGTGFYITPNLVLTCAHVVADTRQVQVRSGDVRLAGEVELAVPELPPAKDEDPWLLPDLALIRVPPRHDLAPGGVAWLELGPDYRISRAESFSTWGYDVSGLTRAPSIGLRRYTSAGRRDSHDSTDAVELTRETIPKYRSGSPVVDLETGRVVGVIKAARARGDGEGGYMTPLARWLPAVLGDRFTEVLNAHDRFHAYDRNWPAACARLDAAAAADTVSSHCLLEARLLDLLADGSAVLSDEEQAGLLAPLMANQLLHRGGQLRDGFLALAGMRTPGNTALHPLLNFFEGFVAQVSDRAGTHWAQDATAWLDECADALGQAGRLRAYRRGLLATEERDSVPRGIFPTLRVHVRPTLDLVGGFDVSVRLYHAADSAEPERGPARPVSRADLWPLLRELIPQCVIDLPRRSSTVLDLIVPLDLLHEPVHLWPLPGLGTIGELLPVIVRSQERWQEERYALSRESLRAAWSFVAMTPVPITWMMCDNALLRGADPGGDGTDRNRLALGLTNPPSSRHAGSRRLVQAAIDQGLPLVVWSAGGCLATHGPDDAPPTRCFGPAFRDRFESVLNGTRLIDLPRKLFELRSRRVRNADDIVLFWDSPDHAYEESLLEEPGYPEVP